MGLLRDFDSMLRTVSGYLTDIVLLAMSFMTILKT